MPLTRTSPVILGAVVAALCTGTAAAALAGPPPDAAPRPTSTHGHALRGTWATSIRISDAPPGVPSAFRALDTFVPGGGLVVSSSAPGPATRSLAHGSWRHTDGRSYTVGFVWFRFDATGGYAGTQRVRRTMQLSPDGRRFRGTDVIEVLAPTGAVLSTLHAVETGTLLRG